MSKGEVLNVIPGRGLGNFYLGYSLHEVLTYIEARRLVYRQINVIYSDEEPLLQPVVLNLPDQGIRLRFDGPSQRLRLIEVVTFSHLHLQYKGRDITKSESSLGPTFSLVYDRLFGPTFPGEVIDVASKSDEACRRYVLSYPGIAFTFPLAYESATTQVDIMRALTSSSSSPAKAMAIFDGSSWHDTRQKLHCSEISHNTLQVKLQVGSRKYAKDVEKVIIGNGSLEITGWQHQRSFVIVLGQTTPQDLITELGPPDAVYSKSDRRLSIHRRRYNSRKDPYGGTSSAETSKLDATVDETSATDGLLGDAVEIFYNYHRYGIDVLVSANALKTQSRSYGTDDLDCQRRITRTDQHVVTKILLHGNVPGSYSFNRYRRCRWSFASDSRICSEASYKTISELLEGICDQPDHSSNLDRRGMTLNRDWNLSPGSSMELLSKMDENTMRPAKADLDHATSQLFGFPGFIFEVLTNDMVNLVTIY